jgi:hypothetical protein
MIWEIAILISILVVAEIVILRFVLKEKKVEENGSRNC